MKFEIDGNRLLNLLSKEVNNARKFGYNIQNHMQAIEVADDEDYLVRLAKSIAFNKRHMDTHLQRAAILLNLVKDFDEENNKVELESIEAKLVALRQELSNQEEPCFSAARPTTLVTACEKAKELGFTRIAYAPVGITSTIDEFIHDMTDVNSKEREYAIYGSLIIHLPDAWDNTAEIYELS